MPEYVFKCSSDECGAGFFKTLAIVNRNAPQDCPDCGEPADKKIAPGVGGVLRGDVWPGKNITVKKQMSDRRERVGQREHQLKMDGPQFNLAPNVGGERVDSGHEDRVRRRNELQAGRHIHGHVTDRGRQPDIGSGADRVEGDGMGRCQHHNPLARRPFQPSVGGSRSSARIGVPRVWRDHGTH